MRKSSRYAAYLPFVLVAVIGLVYHVGMKPMAGDEIFFRDATKDTTLWAYLTQRYLTWTSRVVSECVLVNVIQFPVLWRIIDFLLFATLPLLLSGLFGGGKTMNWCAAAAVLIFPYGGMDYDNSYTFLAVLGIFLCGVGDKEACACGENSPGSGSVRGSCRGCDRKS